MKHITLASITLRNWRGCQNWRTDFHIELPTYICGGNGLGKSRHFDAFCWLLFGKDRYDRKDYEVRTHDKDGNLIHKVECSVEAEIYVDDEIITLKRESKELWQKPSGQIEEVFKGNATECTWNGTPVKVSEFNLRVKNEIIDDTLFKMLTNPHYFLETMTWKQQRECLLQMAGTATDEEIAQQNEEFAKLLEELGGKSLADYRATLANEKKRLKAQLLEIAPRIDQTFKMMPKEENWDAVKASIEQLQGQADECDKQLASVSERNKAANDKLQATWNEILSLQNKQMVLSNAAVDKANADAHKANEERRAIEKQLKDAHSRLAEINIDYKRTEERIRFLEEEAAEFDVQLEALRQEWKDINASQYDGSSICPHCGQSLPEHMVTNAMEAFKEYKAKMLADNCTKGKTLAGRRNNYIEELHSMQTKLSALETAYNEKETECKALNGDLITHPVVKAVVPPFDEIAGYSELQAQIDTLKASVEGGNKVEDNNELLTKKAGIMNAIDEVKKILANKTIIENSKNEIARLQQQGRDLSQQLADIEKREFVAMQFTKKKIEDSESRINQMFERVTFRLFDTTQDGNEFECCVPLVGGVPYGVANTAGQTNAGLDIIRTLCKFNNVCAPIFVDNSESVNDYVEMPCQMIFLQVTTDKELVIK